MEQTPPSSLPVPVITAHRRGGLGQLAATAICGNDITSSCLYVAALTLIAAGALAPISLLVVAGVLYFFRFVYAEVVGALPLNGGAYNALLNTTSKLRASVAACLTILSYMATAVLSAGEAMHYAHALWSAIPIITGTVILLAVFMTLTILGITESARVAIIIFITHLATLTLLLVVGLGYVMFHGFETLLHNIHAPLVGSVGSALFFGFSAAMLGISGYESSADFVEEQAEGVFPKTLRNMWRAVSFFNPSIALLALAVIPLSDVALHKETLLAHLGQVTGGAWLSSLISINAVFVLSGAVLTSFVGVNGLVRRMTLDRCLPQFLLVTNQRGTTHRIIIAFFLLAVSILFITGGDLPTMAAVYTTSFLSVMVAFGVGNILLKVKRSALPRPTHAHWLVVSCAILAALMALGGTLYKHPGYFLIFLNYFIPTMLVIIVMLGRIWLLKAFLFVLRSALTSVSRPLGTLILRVRGKIEAINSQQVVFFTRGDNLANLNRAMLYVRQNETTNRIKVVTVVKSLADVPPRLKQDLAFLNEAYPEMDIEFVALEGVFTPGLVRQLSDEWDVPANLMFIGSPGTHFIYGLAELGGVRLII